ncbi:MAG: rRNA maturation RNase YbeY [bacterium]
MTVLNRQRQLAVDSRRLREVAGAALDLMGLGSAELTVLLVADQRMRDLNRVYRGKDRPTDVLAFPQMEGAARRHTTRDAALPDVLLGDVVIGVQTAERQARERGIPLPQELDLLLVHGLLHLLGFDHTGARAEALRMRRKERGILRALLKSKDLSGTL